MPWNKTPLRYVDQSMSSHDLHELDSVRLARAGLESARRALVEAMARAEQAGHTQREIAASAELSQGEVWRILRRGKLPS